MVDSITDISGAPAETQNNFGLFMPRCLVSSRNARKQKPISIVCHDHSLVVWKTELKTGTKPISVVKWVIPRKLLSCCRDTIMADPAMNPIRVAFERNSTTKPSLRNPKEAWKRPAKKAEEKAS
uniref:Uncharacterized protein n=1 Tax=Rhizophora mucronata TaxID=61149 RepID=A0A2P2J2X3_RHIMU